MSKNMPPHMIPTKDQFREVQIPLHDAVDDRLPPPGWNHDGTRDDGQTPKRPYSPDVPRWDF